MNSSVVESGDTGTAADACLVTSTILWVTVDTRDLCASCTRLVQQILKGAVLSDILVTHLHKTVSHGGFIGTQVGVYPVTFTAPRRLREQREDLFTFTLYRLKKVSQTCHPTHQLQRFEYRRD